MLASRERAVSLLAEFGAIPIEADGSTRVPPALRTAMVALALDVLAGPDSKARRGAFAMLRMLARPSAERRQED